MSWYRQTTPHNKTDLTHCNPTHRFIQRQWPQQQGLEHCKRIRKNVLSEGRITLSVLLCPTSAMSEEKLERLLNEFSVGDNAFDRSPVQAVQVPLYAPLNRTQFESCKHLWPIIYREDTRLDPKFNETQINDIITHMQALLTKSQNSTSEELPVFARVVDPSNNRVVAEGLDTRAADKHPLHHAVMNCIDNVAQAERDRRQSHKRKLNQTECLSEEDPDVSSRGSTPNLEETVEKVAYLCTGFDIYITHEPCTM